MTPILDERDADYRVALVYVRIGRKINLKGLEMQLYKTEDGTVRVVRESAEITRVELEENVAKAKQLLANAEQQLQTYDDFTNVPVAADPAPEAPTEVASPTPQEPLQPSPTEPAPVAPVAPAEPEAPAPAQIVMG